MTENATAQHLREDSRRSAQTAKNQLVCVHISSKSLMWSDRAVTFS